MKFAFILYGLQWALRITALRYPMFRARLKEKDFSVQIRVADNSMGRTFIFKGGHVSSRSGVRQDCDVDISVKSAELGAELMMPPVNHLKRIEAIKAFSLMAVGPDELVSWFSETVYMMQRAGWTWGTPVANGETRYVNNTNGGPVFVYQKAGKIVRLTPIDFDDDDAGTWTINARGKEFTPPRKSSISPHGLASKSIVYSKERNLYPMKRVDFDPNGDRNPQNRGVSGYERISWEEALNVVEAEIKRVNRSYGPGAILAARSSHHTWGNVGYYISAYNRFTNIIGATQTMLNPDSWEGWY